MLFHHLFYGLGDVNGGGAHGIDSDDHKEGMIAQTLTDFIQQVWQRLVHFPHFAFWSAPELGRVEDDAIIFDSAFGFALDVLQRIFYDPADGSIAQTGEFLILARPTHRLF